MHNEKENQAPNAPHDDGTPSFDIPEWFVNGAYQPERARTKCDCEIAAAKAANREKYQRRFTVESGV